MNPYIKLTIHGVAFFKNIKALYNMSPADRKQLGDNAFEYHLRHHERNMVLKQLIDFIFE